VAALPIWLEFMKEAVNGQAVEDFRVPEGIVFVRTDPATGEPVGPKNSPKAGRVIMECFKEGTEPTTH
jgi:penicillin-binding protein 1A